MEMPSYNLQIHSLEPIGNNGRHAIFRWAYSFCHRAFLRLSDPTILHSLPIDLLKVEIAKSTQVFRELPASGLKLRHACKAGGRGSMRAVRKHFAERFNAARTENHVRRDCEIEEIPLRDAGGPLFSPEGNLHESNVSFIALRSDLIAEHRPQQLQHLRLLAHAEKINLFGEVHRRAHLHGSKFSAQQSNRIRHRHSQFLLRDRIKQVRIALLALGKCGTRFTVS